MCHFCFHKFQILYHFDQFDTPLWLWHVGSVRHFDTSSRWPWQSQNFDTQRFGQGPNRQFWGIFTSNWVQWKAAWAEICKSSKNIGFKVNFWSFGIVIFDKTLGPVTCDCWIDWNGTSVATVRTGVTFRNSDPLLRVFSYDIIPLLRLDNVLLCY